MRICVDICSGKKNESLDSDTQIRAGLPWKAYYLKKQTCQAESALVPQQFRTERSLLSGLALPGFLRCPEPHRWHLSYPNQGSHLHLAGHRSPHYTKHRRVSIFICTFHNVTPYSTTDYILLHVTFFKQGHPAEHHSHAVLPC